MTTTVKVTCNGNYVAEVTQDGRAPVLVGPGSMVERSFNFPHPGPTNIHIIERPATAEELEAAKPKES